MDRETIIRMADATGSPEDYPDGDYWLFKDDDIIKFAQLVAAHEREQTARLVLDMQAVQGSIGRILACQDIAAAIRART